MNQFDEFYNAMLIEEDWKKALGSIGLAATTALGAQVHAEPINQQQELGRRGSQNRVSVDRSSARQNLPRGIRNNNPGNLQQSNIKWEGKVKGNDSRFETFASPEYGIRALARNILTYYRRHKLKTLRGIIYRWAPPHENNTEAYLKHVSQITGLDSKEELDLNNNAGQLFNIAKAIIRHENGSNDGKDWYDYKTLLKGVQMAY